VTVIQKEGRPSEQPRPAQPRGQSGCRSFILSFFPMFIRSGMSSRLAMTVAGNDEG
jgi:hypothetical protein